MNSGPPLVPPKGAARRAALKALGLSASASDDKAHAVIQRWIEQAPARFHEYHERFIEPYEPVTRQRVFVSPERYRRIREWQNDPRRAEGIPFEAVCEGGDPEEIQDDDNVTTYRLTVDRIAKRFNLTPDDTTRLASVLRRQWNPAWSGEDPLTITSALTGCAPHPHAARAALKNILRRSPDREPGRPRGAASDRVADIEQDLKRDAPLVRQQVARIWARHSVRRDEKLLALLVRRGVPDSKTLRGAVDRMMTRSGGTEPRRVAIFLLTWIYRAQVPRLREADVKRVLSDK